MGRIETLRTMSRLWLVVLFASISRLCFAQTISQEQWERADRQVRRLPPSAFMQLPKNLIAELQRRGCTIPQVPMIEGLQNVIKGEFAKPGQTDWAVLCSVGRVSSLLVFWNGSQTNVAEVEKAKDFDRLQGWGGDKIVYDWAISPVGKDFIMDRYKVSVERRRRRLTIKESMMR